MAPPYDVITPDDQKRYYAQDERNVVRLIAGLVHPSDQPGDNKYSRAAAFFGDWLKSGVLRRETSPCCYVYQHSFPDPDSGRRLERTGVLCVVRLEPFGSGVLAHERTHTRPKVDRLSLTQAVTANLSPVFALYRDSTGMVRPVMSRVTAGAPRLRISTDGDETHAIWCTRDPDDFRRLARALEPSPLFMADGHHRYETAVNYRNKQRALYPEAPPAAAFNYVLALLVDADDPSLRILPTHRILTRLEGFDASALLDRLGRRHRLTPIADLPTLLRWLQQEVPGHHRFGIAAPSRLAGLEIARTAGADPVARLDVSVLHQEVFSGELGLHEGELESEGHFAYLRDAGEAWAQVRSGRAQAAFLLRPPTVAEVLAVAASGAVMPQKSTYFYPKPLSGIVFNPLDANIVIPDV